MNELKNKKVFVTGGTGFLGSHLLESLYKEGAEVTALYRTEKKLESFLEQDESLKAIKINWLKGDLFSDNWSLDGCDYVYHLAGYVGYNPEDRKIMERVNIEGTAEVLKRIDSVKMDKPRLIYLSSVVAVGAGQSEKEVLNEDSEYNIKKYDFGYFETKRQAEELVTKFCKEGGDAVSLNPSTIYGPRDMLKGSRKFQLKMAQGKLSVCSKGGVSIVHVKDVCDVLLQAACKGESGERYILSGDNITIKQMLNAIADLSKVKKVKRVLPTFLVLSLGYVSEAFKKININLGASLENLQVATMYHWFKNDKAKKVFDFNPRSHRECFKDSLDWAKQKGML
jgi:dihydroflavonol-4-reductase